MKTQLKRFSKSTISVLLAVCLLFSCMTVGLIATSAAQDNSEALGGWSWEATFKMGSNVSGGWDSSGQSATHTSGNNMVTYDFYFTHNDTHSDGEVRFAFWQDGDWDSRIVPTSNGTSIDGSSNKKNCTYGNSNNRSNWYWVYKPEWLSDDGKYYKVTMNLDMNDNNYDGKMWYSTTALTKFSPTLTVPSTGTVGSAITLTGGSTDTGAVGTLTKKYQYSTDNGSTWTDLSSGSYTATSAGTVKFRYKVADGGITSSKAYALSDRIEYSEVKSCTFSAAATTYTSISAAAKGSNDGSTYSTTLSGTPATISASSYTTGTSALTITAAAVSGYTFAQWKVTAGSGTIGSSTSASTTFTPSASNTTVTAQYKKNYTITKNTPSNGTITLEKTSAVAGETFKVTLAPSSGYRVATFTVDSVDKKSSLNSSNEYTHTCTGATSSIAVNATFEAIPSTTIYIKKTITDFSYFYAWNSSNNNALAGNWPGSQYTGSGWSSTSDNKYYYKTFTWECENFKCDLNDNNGHQTGDSIAYATGTSYYINTAAERVNGNNSTNRPALTEGTPTANAITYTSTYSSGPDVDWGGTKPATAYPGDEVSFTVSAKTGYKLTSVTITPAGGSAETITPSSGTYSFTMPSGAVTVTATTVKTYSVTLTTNTGIATKQYKLGSSGTYQDYSSALTVEDGTDVYFKVTYDTGYEFSSQTGLTQVTAGTEYKTGSVTADKSVTINAQKITWSGLSTEAKYSTTGVSGSYDDTMTTYAPTKSAASGTQLDGITVTAEDTVTEGGATYKFYHWSCDSNDGSFTNANDPNLSTTFFPKRANAKAIALYKKVYTITVTTKGNTTGVGTACSSGTVIAGNSFNVTATPGSCSGYKIYLDGGNTPAGSDATYEISNVTANHTVEIEFYSKIQTRRIVNSAVTEENEMTSNADGSQFTFTKENIASNDSFEFKLFYNNNWSKVHDGGAFEGNGLAEISYPGDNIKITPTAGVAIDIVFTAVSDPLKYTSMVVLPHDSTKYNVTFKNVSGSTISGTYMGTNFSTASADAVVEVYSGTTINFTVAAGEGKYISGLTSTAGSLSPAFSTTVSDYSIANVSAASTITPAVANTLKVTCTTNKASWGTITADKEYAAPGETITLTKAVSSGTLTKITVYSGTTVIKEWTRDANGDMKVTTSQSSANQMTQVGITGLAGSIYSFVNKAGEALGASDTSEALGADDPLTFTMPGTAATVTATYEEYVGTSEYVYHGVDTSGNPVSGYEAEPMLEGSINGQKYAYYNVTGRESVNYDQIFYISKGGSSETRYVYFSNSLNWTNLKVYFFNSNGDCGAAWPGSSMTSAGGTDYKAAIPSGATGVIFLNDGGDNDKTADINLNNTSGAYYIDSSNPGAFQGRTVQQWADTPSDAGLVSGTDYKWGDGDYSDHWYSGGFYDQGQTYAKPKDGNGLSFGNFKSDYYIVVLYPNTEYTFTYNGHTTTDTSSSTKPTILWMSTLPGQGETASSTVKVYAKDGTIRRDNDSPERNDRTYSTFEQHANTFVYSDSNYAIHAGTRSSHDGQSSEGSTGYNGYTYDYIAKFEKGQTLYIQTNLDSTIKTDYYLAAYSINGKSYALHDPSESDDGIVQEAFTVPEDWEDKYVEITPIYFKRDTAGTNTITFYVEGYDETVMNAGWGNTPYVYPFYQDANFNYVGNVNNAFGGYPGQPMVFYKGNYYIQLPKSITTTISTGQTGTATIKGVTLGNGYWDDIHLITGEVSSHFQTYDYDDLYKIYTEYPEQSDHIICSFKYRTKKNNDEPAAPVTWSNYNTTNGNGWEVLTNYYGEPVDVFGNVLTEGSAEYNLAMSIINGSLSADSAAVVHAISQDYKSNSAGDYATEWVIYNTAGTKVVASSGGKTSIVPSALAIKADTTGADVASGFDKYDTATKAFKSIYTALYNDTNVRNKPAVVTYEKSIYGGGDKADRCDARWYFSQKNAPITATTRIEYTDNGKDWITDTYTSGTGEGSTTHTKAYFTGTATTATDTPSTPTGNTTTTSLGGHTGDGYYTFKAENAGQYQFVGWYLLRDNYQNISVRSSYGTDDTQFPSHAEMTKNGDIFVARFKKTATGTFDIYHEIHPQTSGYGSVDVSAVVKNGDTVLHTYSSTESGTSSHIQIGNSYIQSGSGNKVVATFTATPYGTSNFEAFYETVQNLLAQHEEYGFIDSVDITADANGGTATVTYDVDSLFTISGGSPVQTVSNVTHYSKFSLDLDHLTYSLVYTFNTRYYNTKLYKYTNVKFTEQELRSYFLDQITDPSCTYIKLDKQFVKAKAPFESNFREDLTWVVDNVSFNDVNTRTIGYLTATQVERKWANATVYDFNNNGDMVTTSMAAPIEKLFTTDVTTKPTYPDTDEGREEEAEDINAWTVENDEMYHPIRTSYSSSGTTVPLYIHHWDIYQLDSFTYKTVNGSPKMIDGQPYNLDVDTDKSKLVAQAYSKRFNYVGYEDYVIVPVYNTVNVDRQGLSDSRTDSSATLLTITRNQWNANAAGNTDSSKYKDGADRVYVDFMLNYNYSVKINGKDTNILLNSTGDNIKVGFIVRSYTWENSEKSYSSTKYVLVDKSQINDKNRMEYCFGFNNTENNRKAGLYYEFKPFIVDTSNQAGSAGCDVTIDNTPYKALYADSTVSVLEQVSFYQLGRL